MVFGISKQFKPSLLLACDAQNFSKAVSTVAKRCCKKCQTSTVSLVTLAPLALQQQMQAIEIVLSVIRDQTCTGKALLVLDQKSFIRQATNSNNYNGLKRYF